MQRVPVEPRSNLESATRRSGILQTSKILNDGTESILWDETSAYVLERQDVNSILAQTAHIIKMSHEAVDFLLDGEWGTLGLPLSVFESLRNSFDNEDLDFCTRYDFAYMRDGSLKLVGIDSDSPRSFIETAHSQRVWLYEKFEQQASQHMITQMNKIPEMSTEAFRRLYQMTHFNQMHIATPSDTVNEDFITTKFIQGLAESAGWEPIPLRIKDVQWNQRKRVWTDDNQNQIVNLLKYFPWEMMLSQSTARKFLTHEHRFQSVFEPSWKMLLSNRAIFPAMHHLFSDSPIISKSYIDEPYDLADGNYVKFPLLQTTSRNEIGYLKNREFTSWGDKMKDFSQQSILGYRKLEIPRRFQNEENDSVDSGRKMFCYVSVFAIAGNIAGMGFRETKLPLLGAQSTFRPHLVRL